jgi:nucleotide-binding universal stress UspA family protein
MPTPEGRYITPMFKKILVPVDLSDLHQQAMEIAEALAVESGGEVILLHVIEVIPELWMEQERDFYARIEQRARAHLAQLGRRLGERKVSRREEVTYGNRSHEIVRYATETGIDLIVLSSHRVDLNDPGSWGTLSHQIGILSQCPVLLVK